MFGRKGDGSSESTTPQSTNTTPRTDAVPPAAPRAQAFVAPSLARRTGEVGPSSSSSSSSSRMGSTMGNNMGNNAKNERRLTVGQGLSLAGEIAECDVLVVEGKVEARLTNGKLLEITESGQFRGNVDIESADIAGRFDGQLTVSGRLTVRNTGRISGMIRYGELEIVAGGQIIGEVQVAGDASAAFDASNKSNKGVFKTASKFAALNEIIDEDDSDSSVSRAMNG